MVKEYLNKIGIVLVLGIMSMPCRAQTIDDVLASIERNNAGLEAIKASGNADVLELESGNVLGGPSVEYSPFFGREASGIASSELIVRQDFDFPTLYSTRRKVAEGQMNVVGKAFKQNRCDLLLGAKLLCIDYIALSQRLDKLREREKYAVQISEVCHRRLDEGDGNLLDANRADMELMDLRTEIARVEAEMGKTLCSLEALNGGKNVTLDGAAYPRDNSSELFAAGIEPVAGTDAAVGVAEAGVDAASRELQLARNEWLPSLSVGFRRNTEMKEGVNGFLVGVSFPAYSTSKKRNAAKARAHAAQLELEQTKSDVVAETRARFEELKATVAMLKNFDIALLDRHAELLRKSLEGGAMTATEYYQELGNVINRYDTYLELTANLHRLNALLSRSRL